MKILLQRVKKAAAAVNGREIASIGPGLLGLVGFGGDDGPDLPQTPIWLNMLKKVIDLRIFPDDENKLNLSLAQFGGELLLVPQFTLYADCRKGRRPSFHQSMAPEAAAALFERFCRETAEVFAGKLEKGVFGEEMEVSLVNWGPATIMLESETLASPRRGGQGGHE